MASSRTSGHLCEQLERALGGTEIGHVRGRYLPRSPRPASRSGMSCPLAIICVPTSMSNVCSRNSGRNRLEMPFPADGIAIHPRDARCRERWCSSSSTFSSRSRGSRCARYRISGKRHGTLLGVVAVVAKHAAVAPMKRECHRTVDALDALATCPACDEAENPRRLSSSIVCSPYPVRSLEWLSNRRRENVACFRVSRNSWRMSISSTSGIGRFSMRSGKSSSVYFPRSTL